MAAVYKAYQPGVERYVAVKVLPASFARDETLVRRFNREARVLASLQHPHILPVFDFGQHEGVIYLVMPFVEGGTLAERMTGQPLSPTFMKRVAQQVGDALDYAHSRGLVHRDIKPANILLDSQGNCLLADFGIAHIFEADTSLTATGTFMGTPTYMSPEQGRGEKVDGRSDLYALGVILYQMATGRVPFQADTPIAVVVKHVNEPPPPPQSLNAALSPAVAQVLLQALHKDPSRRFQKGGALARALSGSLAAPVDNRPPPPPPPPPDASRAGAGGFNRRLLATLLVGLVLLSAACAMVWAALDLPGRVAAAPTTDSGAIVAATQGGEIGVNALSPDDAASPTYTTTTTATATPTTVATATPTASPTVTVTPTPQSDWRQGQLVYIVSGAGEKNVFRQDLSVEGERQPLWSPGTSRFLLGPQWSPDGERVTLYELGGEVYVVDAGNGQGRTSPQSCTSPSWSPDGTQLLCRASNPATFRIFDAGSGALVQSITRPPSAVLPEWSPTANEIVYALLDGNASSIWRLSLENEVTQILAAGGAENYAPSWSPDGQWVAYQSRADSADSEIWIVDRNGQNRRRLTSTPPGAWSRAPSWSPDGQWVAFISNQSDSIDNEHGEVYVVRVADGATERVTFTGGSVYNWRVDWGPLPGS